MQRIASLAAAAVATLFASAALAQMTGVADAQFETIVSVSPDGSAAVLQDAAGQQRTIMLDQSTTITRQGRPRRCRRAGWSLRSCPGDPAA